MDDGFFSQFAEAAAASGLRYLVVGGHAVNAYGYVRTTVDADFLVPENEVSAWREFWAQRGYQCVHATDAFCQFRSADEEPRYPVDLMIVGAETFEKLWDRRQSREVGGAALGMPDPLHLIALKLHALRNEARAEQGKDLPDVLGLIRSCAIDTESAEFKEVLDRYADDKLKKQITEELG